MLKQLRSVGDTVLLLAILLLRAGERSFKMAAPLRGTIRLIITFSVILLVFLTGCGPPEEQAMPTPSGNTSGQLSDNSTKPPLNEITIIPMPYPDKGNPKLDTFLNGLIEAELSGEGESFARQSGVQLIDGKVRVEIQAVSGQIDMTANVTARYGTVEVISYTLNVVQALVPITSLTTLAKDKSIRLIRIPVPSATG